MNKRKLLTALATVGPLLLWAGTALAANSGVGGIDNAFTSGGELVTNALGFGMGIVGVVGVGTGISHGLMHQAEASFATLLGGAGISDIDTVQLPPIVQSPTPGTADTNYVNLAIFAVSVCLWRYSLKVTLQSIASGIR